MASAPKKKSASTGRNPDRRNGKAFKKQKETPVKIRTPEREEKDFLIRMEREKRRQQAVARHAAEMAAKADIEASRMGQKQARDGVLRVAMSLLVMDLMDAK